MISSPLAALRAASSRARSRRKAPTPSRRGSCSGSRLSPGSGAGRRRRRAASIISGSRDSLDAAGAPSPVARPAPFVPAADQPRQLSVTAVETLLRDPYAIFARHVLRLDKLEPFGICLRSAPAGRDLARSFRGFREAISAVASAASERGAHRHRAPNFSRPIWTTRRSRASSGRAFSAWRIGSRSSSARAAPACRRIAGRDELFARARACRTARLSASRRGPTGSSACATARSPSSISRRDRRRGSPTCFRASARSSPSRRRSCGREACKAFRPASSRELCHVALSGGSPAGRRQPVEHQGCRRDARSNSLKSISPG